MNVVLRSAMKRSGFGGTASGQCLLLRYDETGSVGCGHIRTGNGTLDILCGKSVTLQKRLK